ncbi:hypothetical protein [Hoeflea poritis]|uniref:Transmembrane protein n=1 Tax=Hoeflea poritis TaxID=2993659 RepID=A0ABT4VLE1_9HYPH|nr:hypothetical protein [Hoeflea poritis]MDA4845537.1 hypothetical protein [Hoeflea poritis]
MKTRIHVIAGVVGFLTILSFWISTVSVELFASPAAVAAVKSWILYGMIVLVPAMAIAGATGMSLGRKRRDRLTKAKRTRMPVIAANGLLILVPSAFFLAGRAEAGLFDGWFYAMQTLELVAGAANIAMMGLNIRDGLRMTRRLLLT